MKNRKQLFSAVAWSCVVALTGPVMAQNDKPGPTQPTAPSKEPAKPAPKPLPTDKTQPTTPTKEKAPRAAQSTDADFRKLSALVGEWNASTKLKLQPDMEPIFSRAKAHNTLILEGKYLQSETKGEAQGRSFHTMELFAYNAGARRFEQSLLDTRSTSITQFRGTFDSASDAIVFTGEIEDPATGKVVGDKAVMKFVDAKTYVVEVYAKSQDGREFVRMETTYRRAGEAPTKEAATPQEPAKPGAPTTTDKPPAKK